MNLSFKTDEIFKNFCKVPHHKNLTSLLLWLYQERVEIIITSAYRHNDPKTHGTNPLRAVDLRSWIIRNPDILEKKINNAWVYDPKRPKLKVCVYHNIGKGDHFHLQVHDNTVIKGG